MSTALRVLLPAVMLASVILSPSAQALDPNDVCSRAFTSCRSACVSNYAGREAGRWLLFGWRVNLCLIECDVVYLGCLFRRFEQGA